MVRDGSPEPEREIWPGGFTLNEPYHGPWRDPRVVESSVGMALTYFEGWDTHRLFHGPWYGLRVMDPSMDPTWFLPLFLVATMRPIHSPWCLIRPIHHGLWRAPQVVESSVGMALTCYESWDSHGPFHCPWYRLWVVDPSLIPSWFLPLFPVATTWPLHNLWCLIRHVVDSVELTWS